MNQLRFRQIHLDFHTSECIEGIGTQFDKAQFQHALQLGHVDSITVFSKCHHGWAYHDSTANVRHPHLQFDLLRQMTDAAHEIGVNTPIYISAGLDEKLARVHPDWLLRDRDDHTQWVDGFREPGYHLFCFNSPYLDILLAQIAEVAEHYDADGIFLDIVKPQPCYCHNCVKIMRERGLDPYDEDNATTLGEELYEKYTTLVRQTIDRYKPGLPVFHNGGHISKGRRDLCHMNTHLELESLPTGGWGYDHFPASARYVQKLGMEFLGMTGKFHTTWGEFGGFKHPNALWFETALSIANGAKCSIGDQLHPNGKMDELTYRIIGKAYAEVEAKEAWCSDVTSVADVALLAYETVAGGHANDHNRTFDMDTGAVRVLLQSHILFDVVDTQSDFNDYKLLILPDDVRLAGALLDKVQAFIAQGGKVLCTGESGLCAEDDRFALDLGVDYHGICDNRPCYFTPSVPLGIFEGSSFIFYAPSTHVTTTTGASLGCKHLSYFNRETFRFCSHQHTPNSFVEEGAGMVESASGIYIPWKLFSEYANYGNLPAREMLSFAINRLLKGKPTVVTNLPSQGIVTMMKQEKENRAVVHLLYATPIKRGIHPERNEIIEVIEELVPLHDISVTVQTDQPIKRVYLAPQMQDLPFDVQDGAVTVTIDQFTCHQMLVLE